VTSRIAGLGEWMQWLAQPKRGCWVFQSKESLVAVEPGTSALSPMQA
jgi:hypothetical protein